MPTPPSLQWLLPLKRHAECHGITLNGLALLVTVETQARTHSEIAALIGSSTPAVTGLVDRLVAANCVLSTTSSGDRRCKNVTLTPRGREIIDTAAAVCSLRMQTAA